MESKDNVQMGGGGGGGGIWGGGYGGGGAAVGSSSLFQNDRIGIKSTLLFLFLLFHLSKESRPCSGMNF